jgi:hypothetical protein
MRDKTPKVIATLRQRGMQLRFRHKVWPRKQKEEHTSLLLVWTHSFEGFPVSEPTS